MIDKYDIKLFKKFLHLAKTKGTDAIKVVVGDNPDSWVVSIIVKYNKED